MPDSSTGSLSPNTPRRCPECGAENSATRRVCWLCGAPLTSQPVPAREENIYASPAIPEQELSQSFSLSTLLLLVTLVSLGLGVATIAPGLAILLAILVVPALIRTSGIVGRRQQRGAPARAEEKIRFFLGSLGVVTAIGVAAWITFFVVCLGGGFGTLALARAPAQFPMALLIGVGGGALAAIAVFVKMARWLWPYREK